MTSEFHEVQSTLRRSGVESWYTRLSRVLTPEQKQALDEALADKSITPRAIAIVLGKWGFNVTQSQVSHHRRERGR